MNNNKQQPKPENPNNQFSNTEPLTHAQRVAIANTMSNNKQSSVDWLEQELKKIPFVNVLEVFEQAKAMHKDETIDFAMKFMMQDRPVVTFYNETFNNNEQH